MPSSFAPVSTTFISADEGWALGAGRCETPPCTAVVHTVDGGRHWTALATPRVALAETADVTTTPGRVSRIRFTSKLDGWLWGPALYATHDGGQTWKAVAVPPVLSLAANGGTVWAVAATCPKSSGCTTLELLHSSSANDLWTPTTDRFTNAGTPVDLVVQDSNRWVVAGGALRRAVVGGKLAPLSNGCGAGLAPSHLMAIDDQNIVVACGAAPGAGAATPDTGSTSPPVRVMTSNDAGDTWTPSVGAPEGGIDAIATAGQSTVVVAESGRSATLWQSTNGGMSWQRTFSQDSARPQWTQVQFLSPTTAVATLWNRTSLISRDAGATWQAITFAS